MVGAGLLVLVGFGGPHEALINDISCDHREDRSAISANPVGNMSSAITLSSKTV